MGMGRRARRQRPLDRVAPTEAAQIACAEAQRVATFDLSIGQGTYTIDLAAATQTAHRTGFVRALRPTGQAAAAAVPAVLASSLLAAGTAARTLRGFPGQYEDPPAYWRDFGVDASSAGGAASSSNAAECSSSPVPVGSPLFQEVLHMLREQAADEWAGLRLRNIYLCRNREMFDLYCAQKKSLARRLRGGANERWLWHGTKSDSAQKIIHTGFLRDCNHTAAYGRGTYFARSAAYSLNPRYAKPDATGDQYLMLVRVLVGEPCVGSSSMEKPAPKPGSDQLHESMVNRLQDPSIFVLSAGSDNRAYPEFVLRFGQS